MSDPVRIAVVGCGSMGANHVRVAASLPGVRLVGVVDPDADKGRAVGKAFATSAFTDLSAVIAAGIDAAIVAAPTAHHHKIATHLMTAGIHVLVEKPIAATVEEGAELVRLAADKGLVFTVGHVERFNPAIAALRAAVPPADIRSIAITRAGPFPARIGDVGIVLDLGVHDIDLIGWIAGSDIADVSAFASRTFGRYEDCAFLHFRTASGVVAGIRTNWLTPFRERRLEVATADRFFVCDMLERTLEEYSDYGEDGSFRKRRLFVAQTEPLKAEQEAFVSAVRGFSTAAVSGAEGLRALELALACLTQGLAPSQ